MTDKPWNWLEFLEAAIDDEPGQTAYLHALNLSRDWPTCACGPWTWYVRVGRT